MKKHQPEVDQNPVFALAKITSIFNYFLENVGFDFKTKKHADKTQTDLWTCTQLGRDPASFCQLSDVKVQNTQYKFTNFSLN